MKKLTAIALIILILCIYGCALYDDTQSSLPAVSSPVASDYPASFTDEAAPSARSIETYTRTRLARRLEPVIEGTTYDEIMEHAATMQRYDNRFADILSECFSDACGLFAPGCSAHLEFDFSDWKYLASIYRALGQNAGSAIAESMLLSVIVMNDTVYAVCELPDMNELAENVGGLPGFTCVLGYCYMNTLYDIYGEDMDYTEVLLPDSYIATISEPLPGKHIKDGWYSPRSKATRKHTGTDIRAAEGTDVLSCSNGYVQFIGYSDTAGNYIVILDDYGYAYHYYHFVEMTDFLTVGERVSKGQVVGHVGNTGNSDANHLHLTIVTPDHRYINPYTVLMQIRGLADRGA